MRERALYAGATLLAAAIAGAGFAFIHPRKPVENLTIYHGMTAEIRPDPSAVGPNFVPFHQGMTLQPGQSTGIILVIPIKPPREQRDRSDTTY